MKNKIPCQFTVNDSIIYRDGCGYGLKQSHLVLEIEWNYGQVCDLEGFCNLFGSLFDDHIECINLNSNPNECVGWLLKTLGSLMRNFKFATDRSIYSKQLPSNSDSVQKFKVAIPVLNAQATLIGLHWLVSVVNFVPKNQNEAESTWISLQQKLNRFDNKSANQWRTVQAACDLGYPVIPFSASTVCIGTGEYRRLFSSFLTDKTPAISMRICQNKFETAWLLRSHGLPGAQNKLVHTLEEALAAAKEIGFPLVIKPNNMDRGEGVAADLNNELDLIAAYHEASKYSKQVLVEKHQAGFTHRFTVVNGKVMRVAKHVAFGITGDGHSSVQQLVERSALRMDDKKRVWRNLKPHSMLDAEALSMLKQYGLSHLSVPTDGHYVKLRRKDNISAGGQRTTLDLNEAVHSDNIQLAVDVVKLIGLDIGGVDMITSDVSRSWRDLPVTICEINGNPQLVALDDPNMYKRVLEFLLPPPFRVEAQLIVLPSHPADSDLEKMIQKLSKDTPGGSISSKSGIWIDGQFVAGPFNNSFSAARSLAMNSMAKKITFLMSMADVLRYGAPVGKIDVLILPWRSPEVIPLKLVDNYKELMALIIPHALKTMYFGASA